MQCIAQQKLVVQLGWSRQLASRVRACLGPLHKFHKTEGRVFFDGSVLAAVTSLGCLFSSLCDSMTPLQMPLLSFL